MLELDPIRGAIPLIQKHKPLSSLSPIESVAFTLVQNVQQNIDISLLRQRLDVGGDNIWDPLQQKDNVPIQRAGHDKWGIDKIVFIFCDDYLKNIYEFPWLENWSKELYPIFQQLNLPVYQIVRCILARMPPGSKIPVHHDTGEWVKHTHRMHIPIITSPDVDFQVGKNEHEMEKVIFESGNLYELNNASKHKVTNAGKDARVHLIFDYVEPEYIVEKGLSYTRMKLRPDMILYQTRRSLDLNTLYGSRPLPSFIVLGAQKAGTTSLYDYIVQHPLVAPAKRKETHYFDWRWNKALPKDDGQAHANYYHNFFHKDILMRCPSTLTGEATPSYIMGGSLVIKRMRMVLPHLKKLFVILRNPVDRAYSHYCMTADVNGTPEQLKNRGHYDLQGKTFAQIIQQEQTELQSLGINENTTFDEFDSKILQPRVINTTHGGHSFLIRGLYALQLMGWLKEFSMGTELMILMLEDLNRAQQLKETMNKVYAHLNLPSHEIEDDSERNTRSYKPMDSALRDELITFYAPFNKKLEEMLGHPLPW